MRHSLACLTLISVFAFSSVLSAQQPRRQIVEYIRMISEGNTEQVSQELPALRTNLRQNPGIAYIEGLLATDGVTAIKYFRMVSDSFPSNEWADDALVRLAEIYGLNGMPHPMEEHISRLRVKYPESPYITTNYITQISDQSGTSKPAANEKSENEYAIQVGAFSIRENAVKLQRQMQAEGFQADIFENFLDGKNLLYLVWVGSLRSMSDAQHTLEAIQHKLGIKGILRTRTSWKRW